MNPPYELLRKVIRFCLRHQLLPLRVDRYPRLESRAPSLHPRYQASSLRRARPPQRPASVLSSSWVFHLDFSLFIEATGSHVPHKSLRWAHAVFMPVTTRAVSRYPSSSVPGQQQEPGFDDVPTLSTRRQRFTRLPSTHLTGTSRLFRNAHDPDPWTGAAFGSLDSDPAARVRGVHPHLLRSKAASSWPLLHSGLLSTSSWRTVVRKSHHDHISMRPLAPTASASRRDLLARLNTRPARSPANASTPLLRAAPHDSGPMWVATSHSYDFCIHCTSPV
jgi:hypothetical protein